MPSTLGSEATIAPELAFAFRRLSRADIRINELARAIGMSLGVPGC